MLGTGRLPWYSGSVRILITGATGFVGTAVAERCALDGHEVNLLVRRPEAAKRLAARGCHVHAGSVGDPNEVLKAARDCEVVVHAAAVASHRSAPEALDWVNVAGTENVLRAAHHAGCRRVVHVSCADVTLANMDRVHWDEDRYLDRSPLGPHAHSKQLAEELVLSASSHDLETTAVRPAILWGPGDTTTLPLLCREALAGGVRLWGGGKNLVTTTYIDHMVDALVTATTAERAAGRAYQIADGEFQTAAEFFGALCRAAELPPPRRALPYGLAYAMAWARERVHASGPWRPDVIHRARNIYLDYSRALHELGTEPRVPFAEGIERTATWVREMGGPEAVAKMGRPPATAEEVQAQIELAHSE